MAAVVSLGVAGAAEKVEAEKAAKLIKEDKVTLIDARTQKEWDEGHLEGAKRIEIAAEDFDENAVANLDRDKPVLVYCRSGGRSAKAAERLEKLGFKTVYDLKGGIVAWKAAGKKVVK